jgi:RNA-directed DNA polymerase
VGDRTLEQAFNAVFHNKESFTDFCSFDLSDKIEVFHHREREIYRVSKKLKDYLRFLDKVVLRHIANNEDAVHSYIKGKSVLTAVKVHANNRAFFLTDIKSFFSKISEEDVRRVLIRDKHLIPIADWDAYIPHFAKIMTCGGSIPVGFPTSPKLSNSFLFEFDNSLHEFSRSRELTYTRYSDDIIISGADRDSLLDLRDIIQDMLHQYSSDKLFLNVEKTRITHIGNKVKILGLVITPGGRVTVDIKYKRTLECLLHFYATDKDQYNSLLNKTFGGKEHSLFGMLNYVKSVDPIYLEKLQRKYGVLVLHTLMEDRWHGNR